MSSRVIDLTYNVRARHYRHAKSTRRQLQNASAGSLPLGVGSRVNVLVTNEVLAVLRFRANQLVDRTAEW